MDDIATRATAPPKASILKTSILTDLARPVRDLRTGSGWTEPWRSIPLECFVCAAAIFIAAGLKLAGLMP